MAFPTSTYGTLRDVLECHATQKHPLGTRLVMEDGRVFHYAKNGGTQLAKAKVVCSPLVEGDENVDLELQDALTTASRVANPIVTMSTAAAYSAAHRFKDGYMIAHTGTGAGQMVMLSDNDKGGTSAGTAVKVYFKDENYLTAALDTSSSRVGLVQNPYCEVVVCPAWADFTPTARPAGVPLATITASYYFWLQTWGPCPVLAGNAPVEGADIIVGGSSTGTAGDVNSGYNMHTSAAAEGGAVNFPALGMVMSGDTDAEYMLVFLMIDP
jgi:hypothetical protein